MLKLNSSINLMMHSIENIMQLEMRLRLRSLFKKPSLLEKMSKQPKEKIH
jgi:hypothetical protein